jgi:hypothetical protein
MPITMKNNTIISKVRKKVCQVGQVGVFSEENEGRHRKSTWQSWTS